MGIIADSFVSLTLNFPEEKTKLTGTDFVASIIDKTGKERDLFYMQAIDNGNFPSFYKIFKSVTVDEVTYLTAPNYLCIGTDDDYVILGVTATVAQYLCDKTNCIMPTRKMVDQIFNESELKLQFNGIPPDNKMTSTRRFKEHSDKCLKAIGTKHDSFIGGIKKDYVLTNKLAPNNPKKRIAIYGWNNNGKIIQGLNAKDHDLYYVDYSQSVRLISKECYLNGESCNIIDVLQNPQYCNLLSDEGVLNFLSY